MMERDRQLLMDVERIAVVGCSDRPSRDSNRIARYLIDAGYVVHPVNPHHTEILGRTCHPDLQSIPGGVDLAVIFRRPEYVATVVDDAIIAGVPVIWLQPGVENPVEEKRAQDAGIEVVSESCIQVIHRILQIPVRHLPT